MSKWLDKLSNWTESVKDSAVELSTKAGELAQNIDVLGALGSVSDTVVDASRGALSAGMDRATEAVAGAREWWDGTDFSALRDPDAYRERFQHYYALSSEKAVAYYRTTFEVDKTTEEMIRDVRARLPTPAQTFDDIFEQCKREATHRAVAAFFLAPVMQGLDQANAQRNANFSQTYAEFKGQNNLHDHPNFAALSDERYAAKQDWTLLENGYNGATPVNPFDADIEHIVPKTQVYNDWLLRLGTNDDQIIDVMNNRDNLIFADYSVNRSKGAKDLLAYLDQNGTVDTGNPDSVHLTINGRDVTVSRADAEAHYTRAAEQVHQARVQALKTAGVAVGSASALMAAQQVVGLIVVETIDIVVDEIRDMATHGSLMNENGLWANLAEHKAKLTAKLSQRFEERDLWAKAKEAGIEGGVAGALAAIPQVLMSLFLQLPALVLGLIRECTLGVVRGVRVLMTPSDDWFDQIKVIMLGTASAAMGVYVANIISKGLAAVPLMDAFNGKVSAVLSGVVVTAVPLTAIYVFEQNKTKLVFKVLAR